jgi:hypothetical protein
VARTWPLLGLYVAGTWLWAHFCFLVSAFCFGSVVALGSLARHFFILHSAFYIRPAVASG